MKGRSLLTSPHLRDGTVRRFKAAFAVGLFVLALAGCGQGGQAQDEQRDTAAREPTAGGPAASEPTGGEVTVGGFSVEGTGVPETNVPRVSVEREGAREYLDQTRPIVEDTVRDVSGLVQPRVRLENGDLALDVKVSSLKEARQDVRDGLKRLRETRPPEGLGPVHERLTAAYEGALPAYSDVIEAAESGDPGQLGSAVRESLPRIERFNAEARGIVQDLEQAVGTR